MQKFLKDTFLFSLLSVFAALIALFIHRWTPAEFSASSFGALTLALLIIFIGFDSLRRFVDRIFEKHFFKKEYDYQQFLKDASRGMSKIESLNRLMGLVVHFVTLKMKVKNAAVITGKPGEADFRLMYQRGYDQDLQDRLFPKSHPLIEYLQQEKEALDIRKIRKNAGNPDKGGANGAYDYQNILTAMEKMEAFCCIPSFLGRDLKSVLVLGGKKSGEDYTKEDIDVLYTLAQESAIAIENARLYDEAVMKSKELANINEQLEYSKELLMKALRETEVANKQLQDTQAQLIHEQKMATLGRLAASVGHEVNNPLTILSMNVSRALLKHRKDPDVKVSEILDLFHKMEQNVGRIKAVVNTLTGLLKRSEKGKFEPLSLKLILEETLPLVQFQTYLDNLTGTEVEFDVPSNIPLIRGDLERLQEVFLNLFINAYHAMSGKRNRRIRVRAERQESDARFVAVHFADNGSGMSEETRKKIFNYGYTTKPPGKGSGMGLYMCKYIIELHGGRIHVTSELGQGTTFTLTLPVYEELSSNEEDGIRLGVS